MKKILPMIALVTAILFGCKKDNKSKPNTPSSSGTYFPVTKGSTWQYIINEQNNPPDTLIITMTGATDTSGGITWYMATSYYKVARASANLAFSTSNHLYQMRDIPYFNFTYELLNDTASVGYSWQSVPSPNGLKGELLYNSIVEKNVTKTVRNKTFTNVSHTQDSNSDMGRNDYYLAKGVGIIEIDVTGPNQTSPITYEKLDSYTIK